MLFFCASTLFIVVAAAAVEMLFASSSSSSFASRSSLNYSQTAACELSDRKIGSHKSIDDLQTVSSQLNRITFVQLNQFFKDRKSVV